MNKTVQCKECGTEYNRSLTYCPECGYSTKKYVNKRFIAFVIVYVFLVLIMLGWGAYLYLNHKQLHEKAELQEKTEQRKKEARHKQALKDDEYVSKIKEERAKALNEIEIAYRNSEREYLERINAEYQNESKQYSNNGINQTRERDLALFDKLSEIDLLIEESKQRTLNAYNTYMEAIRKYGTTIPAFQYQGAVHKAIDETEDLCKEAIRILNSLQTVDANRCQILYNKYKNQNDGCRKFHSKVSQIGHIR